MTIATAVGLPLLDDRLSTVSVATTFAIAKANATIAAMVTTPGRSPGASGSRLARTASSFARLRA